MANPSNGHLTSEDILLMDERIGRCYLCYQLEYLEELVDLHVDSGETVKICEDCNEREDFR